MTEEEKNQKRKNFERMMLAFAILLGMPHKTYEELADSDIDVKKVVAETHKHPEILKIIQGNENLTDKQIRKAAVESFTKSDSKSKSESKTSDKNISQYRKVDTVNDGKICQACKKWQDKIIDITGMDKNYPSLEDYIKSGAFHPNCRCILVDVTNDEIKAQNHISDDIQNIIIFT